MVNFSRKSNSTPSDALKEALDILLDGKSDEYKGRVLALVRKHKIDANDPIFLLVAGISNIDVALIDTPKQIDLILNKFDRSCVTQTVRTKQLIEELLVDLKEELNNDLADSRSLMNSFKTVIHAAHEENKSLYKQNKALGEQIEATSKQFKKTESSFIAERTLRMERPFLNAMSIPSYMFYGWGALLLILGTLVGSIIGFNLTNQSAKFDARFDKIESQLYNLNRSNIHINGEQPVSKKKYSSKKK